MRARPLAVTVMLLLALVATAVAPIPAQAKKLKWSPRLGSCEPPAVSTRRVTGRATRPAARVVEGMCAGGAACPASGACPGDGKTCAPSAIAPRPNVILFISDDQGYCDYGSAGECRSVQTGTPIPPPSTPNLDLLAGYGTIFPIAHNTASWCFPSLATIVTGRYQKDFGGKGKAGDKFVTIAKALHNLGGTSGTLAGSVSLGQPDRRLLHVPRRQVHGIDRRSGTSTRWRGAGSWDGRTASRFIGRPATLWVADVDDVLQPGDHQQHG